MRIKPAILALGVVAITASAYFISRSSSRQEDHNNAGPIISKVLQSDARNSNSGVDSRSGDPSTQSTHGQTQDRATGVPNQVDQSRSQGQPYMNTNTHPRQ